MNVTIIGAAGLVGSNAAFALQCGGLVRELALLDLNESLLEGHALDMLHGAPSVSDTKIVVGGFEQIPSSDLVCITAGIRRKPDESRLNLIQRNATLFGEILDQVASAGLRADAIVVVVSNPVDVLTYLATRRLQLPAHQIIGLGTQLDSNRLCAFIAQRLGVPPTQTKALILGEHGDSMVPIWSSATVAGLPLNEYPGWNQEAAREVFEKTRTSGAAVIERKGGSGFGVGVAIRDVVEAIALDRQSIMPVSTLQTGCYGLSDVALSVPTVLGRRGAIEHVEIKLSETEMQGLQSSGATLKATIETVTSQTS